ncbi:hypothetical protein [Paraburkholderia sp. GAS82]|uniref:hypothetical protein n=1 Tax=Paraburkholderia sp. GAS82 TaxID=3035137 RepID=UPI003D2382F3
MDLIRIRKENLSGAITFADLLGLTVDEIYGDRDDRYINIGARQKGPIGNRMRRWTDDERRRMTAFLCDETDRRRPQFTYSAKSRCRDEVSYFAGRMTTAELQQFERRTTKRPLICLAAIVAAHFVAEGICRFLGA